ncbi:hypothetical protein [Poseidonocella sp. HB161398]|uniref:hypothetical protein n=1 Tax=Poseidonocella sp. HB161398 TaxID=2320855 RepID=UPI0011087E92|nr:hypothetical protein [Poseidonocella sp. HB161398]
MWSQIIGLGMGALGAWQSGQQASAAQAQAAQQYGLMRQQMQHQQFMGMQAMNQMNAENAYIRQKRQNDQLLAEQEREWQIGQMGQFRDTLTSERQYEIDRQVEMDREAARVEAMRYQQLLQNQRLTAQERKYAEQQLAQAQALAQGERDDDMRRYYEEKSIAQQERDFVLGEYSTARRSMEEDRMRDLQLNERILGQTDQLQRSLKRAQVELGSVPDVPTISREELDAEIAGRVERYQSDVDRAATRVASQNEANLIRAGLDASTTGTAKRSDITRRIADEYQSARDRAYDDALAFITGKQGAFLTDYNAQMGHRQNVLNEIGSVASAGLDTLMGMPDVTTLAGLSQLASAAPSANVQRSIQSGNLGYVPLGVSAIYDNAAYAPASRLSDYQVSTSVANPYAFGSGVDTAITGYQATKQLDPSGFFQNSANMAQSNYASAQDRANSYEGQAQGAWGSFMKNNVAGLADTFDTGWSAWQADKAGNDGVATKNLWQHMWA